MIAAFLALFSPSYRRRTLLNSLYLFVSIIGLWAGSVYVPASVTQIAVREGYTAGQALRVASYATMLLSAGTILGCLILPPLADTIGAPSEARALLRGDVSVHLGRFRVRVLPVGARSAVVSRLSVLSRDRRRELCDVHLVASGAVSDRLPRERLCVRDLGWPLRWSRHHVSGRRWSVSLPPIGTPVALTSITFLVGILMLPLGEETRGQTLPG